MSKLTHGACFRFFALSTLSSSMRGAKFLPRPIFFESGWNWNLKFGFLGHSDQKTIFQTKWTKNTDKLKIYLVWFSTIVCRGQLAFCTKYLCYFRKFSVKDNLHEHLCTFMQFFIVLGFICVALRYYAAFKVRKF